MDCFFAKSKTNSSERSRRAQQRLKWSQVGSSYNSPLKRQAEFTWLARCVDPLVFAVTDKIKATERQKHCFHVITAFS